MTCECVKCGEIMENVMDGVTLQPMGGTAFASRGHYGSTVFDPMDGSVIEIAICDGCLRPLMGTPSVFHHAQSREG